MRSAARLSLLVVTVVLCADAHAGCKGAPLVTVSYDGGGMVINGKHLVVSVCDSGEVEFDNSSTQGWRWRKDKAVLTPGEKEALLAFLDRADTRSLSGRYVFGKVGVRDHWEQVEVVVHRRDGEQHFSVVDFYGLVENSPESPVLPFLCRVEKLRKGHDNWKPLESLPCGRSAAAQ